MNVTGFPFPLTPFLSRRTTRKTLIENVAWSFEQEQGIGFGLGVTTNVRMTVIRLNDGSLWVHDPIAPTEECVELLRELGGEVKYAVLSTTMYEHKIFAGPFQRAFKSCAAKFTNFATKSSKSRWFGTTKSFVDYSTKPPARHLEGLTT